jgi:hypothetical protein
MRPRPAKSRGEQIAETVAYPCLCGCDAGVRFGSFVVEFPSTTTLPRSLERVRQAIAAAIDQAIAEEREACGEVAEQLPTRRPVPNISAAAFASTVASLIAAAIRARGSK